MRTKRKHAGLSLQARNTITGYLFLAPSMVGFLVIILIPMVCSLILSFTEWDMVSGLQGVEFIGLDNYRELFTDKWFVDSLRNNIAYTVMLVPTSMALGLLLAILLNQNIYLKQFLRTVYFMPYISNVVAVSVVWMAMFNPSQGPINGFLQGIGIENPPRCDWALVAIAVIGVWIHIGYNMVIYLAALQNIPKELYEAAEIDRAGGWRKFWRITLPLLSPNTFFLLITGIISSFKVFGTINIITKGGPGSSTSVLVYYLYTTAFRYYRMGYASTLAWILFILIFVVTLIQWKGQRKWVNYM